MTSLARPVKVRLRDVSKRYSVQGRRIDALTDIELDIRTGEFLCIVGPSGCGKSTLLRLVAGLDMPTGGYCEFTRDSAVEPRALRPLNSMVFQDHIPNP